ncbi:hypothetical protein [Tabrizicola sp.]|uniref:hypothetical protein n=1 Tax=Tabrizicola sp. TaxID=2005166 RepID=UPI002733C396|nr:hypothetical protein [Tabrizicola sp.]MDP3197891.1 hypothetical protein [Tabrizicola sp.]
MSIARVLALVLLASPALAEGGPTEAQRKAFIAAITANGCQMTEAEAEVQLPAAGIDRETSGLITDALLAQGLAEVNQDQSTLTLRTEGCAS